MNSALLYLFSGFLSYLLGAIPFGLLIARSRGVDIRTVGSGNIGATNVFRCVGKSWGILTFFLDGAKGFTAAFLLPLLMTRFSTPLPPGAGLGIFCALCAVAGHNWPVWLKFKGGKGVATSAGALLGVAPAAMGIGLLVWVIIFLTSRYVSLASLVAALMVAATGWIFYFPAARDPLLPIALTGLALITLWRHKTNIRRLLDGTENRFDFRKKK